MNGGAPGFRGEMRRLDAGFIKQATAGLDAPVYHVAGPPRMVDGLRQALAAAGVDDDDVRSEEFHGY